MCSDPSSFNTFMWNQRQIASSICRGVTSAKIDRQDFDGSSCSIDQVDFEDCGVCYARRVSERHM